MTEVKFIHTADLHLDSPFIGLKNLPEILYKRIKDSTFRSYKRVIDLAIREQVDFIIISGDIYDGNDRSLRAQIKFRDQLTRLTDHNVEVFIIHGNHDHLDGQWVPLDWPDFVHFFAAEVQAIPYYKNGKQIAQIYGYSYPEREVSENIAKHYSKQGQAHYHIGVIHGTVTGAEGHDPYAPFALTDLLEKDFDYWALGHIHKQQIVHTFPPVIYPGNIQGRHRKESGEKGCFLVELNEQGANWQFCPTADIIWDELTININNLETTDELITALNEGVTDTRRVREGVFLSIFLKGAGSLHSILHQGNFLDDLIESIMDREYNLTNFVWIIGVRLETSMNINREKVKYQSSFIGDLLEISDQYQDHDVDRSLQSLYSQKKYRKLLPNLTNEHYKSIMKEAEEVLLLHLLDDTSEG